MTDDLLVSIKIMLGIFAAIILYSAIGWVCILADHLCWEIKYRIVRKRRMVAMRVEEPNDR